MTDQEPTYRYVKGKGWVASMYETHSFETTGHRVTLIERTPEIGEHHFKTDITPANIERELTGRWWQEIFSRADQYKLYIPPWTAHDIAIGYQGKIYTVLVEKL